MKLIIDSVENKKENTLNKYDSILEFLVRNGCPNILQFSKFSDKQDLTDSISNWIIEMDISMGGDWIPDDFLYTSIKPNSIIQNYLDNKYKASMLL